MPNTNGFDWWDEHVTNEIYLSTHRADWWKFCGVIAALIAPHENVIDIGTGDGHTLWQIISSASALPQFRVNHLTLVEPNESGLRRAIHRCCELPVRSVSPYRMRFEQFASGWRDCVKREKYDVLFASHVNYYLGTKSAYRAALDAMTEIARTVILVTGPRTSDYYKVVRNPFGNYVYSDVVAAHYRSRGLLVKRIGTTMRFYVEHVNQSRHEAIVLWKFFNNTERQPTDVELARFIANTNRVKDGDGNINFRDDILVATAQ
jgi:hypothetical protein